jgi:hypothetical protein
LGNYWPKDFSEKAGKGLPAPPKGNVEPLVTSAATRWNGASRSAVLVEMTVFKAAEDCRNPGRFARLWYSIFACQQAAGKGLPAPPKGNV